ncbi:MAG: Rrf2 family transcriptional regulator [candidate division Zixibacteria bacterium]|nr:Rrf2 family transcriptional regulator [candidate division Zixibacteria bacterium]MCI0596173.1 Rrf2 family transcriptional regulator [candidate division Zixibacteria bacterium]
MIKILPLSKGCQNALRVAVYFSTRPAGTIIPREEASRKTKIPSLFLAKILQTLTRAGVLRSHLGAERGYSLARPAEEMSLFDVVRAYDGPVDEGVCVLDGARHCPGDLTCALHEYWTQTRKDVVAKLASISVAEVALMLSRKRNGDGTQRMSLAKNESEKKKTGQKPQTKEEL